MRKSDGGFQIRLRGVCAVALGVWLALGGGAQAGSTLASPWAKSEKSRARLIAAGGLENGRYQAGIEIELSPNFHTYWRSPGEAGVPPVFDFSKARNLAVARIVYPAPTRFNEAGLSVFGYRDRVLFPIDVTPADGALPTILNVELSYAVCETICIPAEARMSLELWPKAPRSNQGALIETFAARAPRKIAPGEALPFTLEAVAPRGRPTWRVTLAGPASGSADLFAEGPDGWYFDTRPAGDKAFEIVLAEKPVGASLPVEGVRLTLTDGERAVEASTRLDAVIPKP